ncbi:hypothetical protein D3C84_780760 [compost metagenome]
MENHLSTRLANITKSAEKRSKLQEAALNPDTMQSLLSERRKLKRGMENARLKLNQQTALIQAQSESLKKQSKSLRISWTMSGIMLAVVLLLSVLLIRAL